MNSIPRTCTYKSALAQPWKLGSSVHVNLGIEKMTSEVPSELIQEISIIIENTFIKIHHTPHQLSLADDLQRPSRL